MLPAHRLLDRQEVWAAEYGFPAVTVKSMNRYPAMLHLLIRNGYRIPAVEHFSDPALERITSSNPCLSAPFKATRLFSSY